MHDLISDLVALFVSDSEELYLIKKHEKECDWVEIREIYFYLT